MITPVAAFVYWTTAADAAASPPVTVDEESPSCDVGPCRRESRNVPTWVLPLLVTCSLFRGTGSRAKTGMPWRAAVSSGGSSSGAR